MSATTHKAFFDLSGTILDHTSMFESKVQPVPGMPDLINNLVSSGWSVALLSRWPEDASQEFLKRAQFDWPGDILYSRVKGEVISQWLEENPEAKQAVFVDDRPDNLDSALEQQTNRLLTIAFLGSGKYSADLHDYAKSNQIDFAETASDLAAIFADCKP